MIQAFGDLGYNVVQVTGHSSERLPTMRSIRRDIRNGRRFEFCYAESVNSPTALSDPSHLPLHPVADPWFFACLRRAGISSGLFLRDIYWRFDEYRVAVPPMKRVPAEAFHRFDLTWYARLVDLLYLPDTAMAALLPGPTRFDARPLAPGANSDPVTPDQHRYSTALRIGYIGSVSPPHYRIDTLLSAIAETADVELEICMPEAERDVLTRYPSELLEGIETCHLTGDRVSELYQRSDVMAMVFEHHDYRDFAMPVKLFEAIGYGLPCIATSNTAAGRFVETNELGWVVEGHGDLRQLLERLARNPEEVSKAREQVLRTSGSHTWRARAETVASDLGRQRH
jgi:glycosyltransferase involved in cell wall biosynthesis